MVRVHHNVSLKDSLTVIGKLRNSALEEQALSPDPSQLLS